VAAGGQRAWPAWATEQVDVVPPDGTWRQSGEHERRLLDSVLAPWLVAPVEHVGSTAVPGLAAKPILDLQAAVNDLDCAGDVAAALAPAGWHQVPPELDGRPWRRLLVKAEGDRRVAHLHLMWFAHARWREQLLFRDALRADVELARRYAAVKLALAKQHTYDREAYTAGKAAFIAAALNEYR